MSNNKGTNYCLTKIISFTFLGLVLSYLLLAKPEKTRISDPIPENTISKNVKIIDGSIKKNSSLYLSMANDGIPLSMINTITKSLYKVFDLKHSLPGDRYHLGFIPPDTLVNFEYKSTGREKFIIHPKDDSLAAFKVYKDLKRFLRGVRGKVKGSLWETMVKMGEDPVLIGKLADIFAWEIDFLTDVREGNEFDFVVEGFEEEGNTIFYGDILVARYMLNGTDHYAFLYQDPDGNRDYYDLNGRSLRKTLVKSPLNYRKVTSKYSLSRLHPILKIRRPHYGVDYAAKKGTPVISAGDGRIILRGWRGEYGNTVIIRHSHGYQTYYGHLTGFARGIEEGKKVKQSQLIGYVGSTGLSTGPHLDYRVKRNGKFIDPLKMVLPSASPIPDKLKKDYSTIRDELLLTLQSVTAEKPAKIYVDKPQREASPQLASVDDRIVSPQ